MRIIALFFTLFCSFDTLTQEESEGYERKLEEDILVIDTSSTSSQKTFAIDGILSLAKTFLGTPYRYAGSTPSGFDCSGFINYIMKQFGISLPRTSYNIAELGKTIRITEVQPGDLLFFKGRNINSTRVGHIALVIEVNDSEIKMIHASSSRGVVIDNFKSSKYYIPRFIKAKRLDYTYSASSDR